MCRKIMTKNDITVVIIVTEYYFVVKFFSKRIVSIYKASVYKESFEFK